MEIATEPLVTHSMFLSPEYLWLIAGAVCLVMEVFIITGIGFLFAGLAAICVGGMVGFGMIGMESFFAQFAWFFGLMIGWGAALWKTLKNFKNSGQSYSDMVGNTAIIAKHALKKGHAGNVTWSGTLMRAELAAGVPVDELPVGTTVKIMEVKGNIFIVEPVKH